MYKDRMKLSAEVICSMCDKEIERGDLATLINARFYCDKCVEQIDADGMLD